MSACATMFLVLVACHYAIDFCLQSDAVAAGKNPANSPYKTVPWYQWMAGHVAPHGLAVGVVTGSAWLGVAEAVVHFGIDWLKCNVGRIPIYWAAYYTEAGDRGASAACDAELAFYADADQAAHVGCKMVWTGLYFLFLYPGAG